MVSSEKFISSDGNIPVMTSHEKVVRSLPIVMWPGKSQRARLKYVYTYILQRINYTKRERERGTDPSLHHLWLCTLVFNLIILNLGESQKLYKKSVTPHAESCSTILRRVIKNIPCVGIEEIISKHAENNMPLYGYCVINGLILHKSKI